MLTAGSEHPQRGVLVTEQHRGCGDRQQCHRAVNQLLGQLHHVEVIDKGVCESGERIGPRAETAPTRVYRFPHDTTL